MSGVGFAFNPLSGDIYPGITQSDIPFLPSGMQVGGFSVIPDNIPGVAGNMPGVSSGAPTPWDQLKLGPNIGLGTQPGIVDGAVKSVAQTIGFFASPARIATAVLGIVLIAGGLYLFGKGPGVTLVQREGTKLLTGA